MAASSQIIHRDVWGSTFVRGVDVTLDNSYPAGGYPVSSKDAGFGQNGVILNALGNMSKDGGWLCGWNQTTQKLQVFDGSGGANLANHEVTAGTVLTGVSVRLLMFGRGSG